MATVVSNLVIQLQVQGASQAKAQVVSVQQSLAQLLGTGGVVGAGAAIGGGSVFGVFHAVSAGIRLIVSAMRDFMALEREIATIRQLTGGTTREAAGLAIGMRATGVQDVTAIREVIHLIEAQQRGSGLGAQRLLGVHALPGESGTSIFLKDIQALSQIQDGVRKTNLEMKLFGARGVAAIQPFLEMTKEQTREWKNLTEAFNTDLPNKIREFTTEWGLLQQAFENDILGPLLAKLLPVLTEAMELATDFFDGFHDLVGDDLLGILEMAAAFAALAAVVGVAAAGIAALGAALTALGVSLSPLLALIGTAAIAGAGLGIKSWVEKQFLGGKDKTEENTKRAADYLEDIRGHLLGNVGPRGRRALSAIEADYVLAHTLSHGMA